jgi:hypothetical protein
MKLHLIKKIGALLLLIGLIVVGQVWAAMTPAQVLNNIQQRRGIDEGSYVIEVKITSYHKQEIDTAKVKVYQSKNGVLVTFTAPARRTKELYLLSGNNTWIYQTGLLHPIRISPRQALFGNAGIAIAAGLNYARDYKVAQATETNNQYQFDLEALDTRTAYQQASLWIDKNGLFLRKVVLKGLNGQPLMELINYDYKQIDGHEFPTMEIRNLTQKKEDRTIMEHLSITSRELPPQAFNPTSMDKFRLLIKD